MSHFWWRMEEKHADAVLSGDLAKVKDFLAEHSEMISSLAVCRRALKT